MEKEVTFDCSDCEQDKRFACDDCLVNFIIENENKPKVIFTSEENKVLRLLQGVGLLPEAKYQKKAG